MRFGCQKNCRDFNGAIRSYTTTLHDITHHYIHTILFYYNMLHPIQSKIHHHLQFYPWHSRTFSPSRSDNSSQHWQQLTPRGPEMPKSHGTSFRRLCSCSCSYSCRRITRSTRRCISTSCYRHFVGIGIFFSIAAAA